MNTMGNVLPLFAASSDDDTNTEGDTSDDVFGVASDSAIQEYLSLPERLSDEKIEQLGEQLFCEDKVIKMKRFCSFSITIEKDVAATGPEVMVEMVMDEQPLLSGPLVHTQRLDNLFAAFYLFGVNPETPYQVVPRPKQVLLPETEE